MKPESILQSDLLDIIFENRNKEYGAYALRKNYDTRLLKALGTTCLLVIIFIVAQSMKQTDKSDASVLLPCTFTITEIELPADKPVEKTKAGIAAPGEDENRDGFCAGNKRKYRRNNGGGK